MGIYEAAVEYVFERSFRAEEANRVSGLGLDLQISAGIIRSHRGKIKIRSKGGQCSLFYFTLPIVVQHPNDWH
jgi:signal transduction histidine kinase